MAAWLRQTRALPEAEVARIFGAATRTGNAVDHIFLVDPLGNLMMRFPREPDPSRVRKDLERLLRYSRGG